MNFTLLSDWYFTITIMTSLIYYIRYKWNRRRFEAMAAKLPGPNALPFIGNLLHFKGVTLDDFIYKVTEVAKEFLDHGVVRLWFGPILFIGLYEPADAEAVLCNPRIIDKSLLFSFFYPRDKGAFTNAGEKWREQRKLVVNKMFHVNLSEKFIDVFNEQSVILVKYLTKAAKSGTFDVSHALSRCTLDFICRNALGVNMQLQEDESVTFPEDITKSSDIILERFYKPWLYPTWIFNMTDIGKELFRRIEHIHQFTVSVIRKRRQIIEEFKSKSPKNGFNKTDHNNYLLQEHTEIETAPYIDALLEKGKAGNLSDKEIALEALDVIIGGMDTTAIADSYVLLMLGIHKEWQEKVHKEIDEVFGNSDRPATVSDLAQLVNLDMVIKEVLRLYTAPHTVRFLTEDVKSDKHTLPAGAIVYLSTFTMHRSKEYWSNPDEFYPEHFLPENIAARPKYSFLPFNAGPRGCPGYKYGTLSMKVLLTHVLRSFSVESDLKFEDMKHKPSLMLELVGGYPVKLYPRQACFK